MTDIATVTVVFSKTPGGPPISAADLVAWADALLNRREIDGFNSLRYSTGRIVSASLISDTTNV